MTIKLICVHCSATKPSQDIGREEIDQWHRERGFTMIGYSYVIRRDGSLEKGRPEGAILAHARGHNEGAIAVCLIGGVDEQGDAEANYTQAEWISLKTFLDFMELKYPEAETLGHRDLPDVNKACPCFDVRRWRQTGEIIA